MIAIIDCGTSWLEEIKQNVEACAYTYHVLSLHELPTADLTPYTGIIISGAPTMLSEVDLSTYLAPFRRMENATVPILGICLGHQIIGLLYGAEIARGEHIDRMERIDCLQKNPLFAGLESESVFREDHSEYISVPEEFTLLAQSVSCANEVMKHKKKPLYGVQFHPEVSGEHGKQVFKNFIEMCTGQIPHTPV